MEHTDKVFVHGGAYLRAQALATNDSGELICKAVCVHTWVGDDWAADP